MSHQVLDSAFGYVNRVANPFPAVLCSLKALLNAVTPWLLRQHSLEGDREVAFFLENLDTLTFCTHIHVTGMRNKAIADRFLPHALRVCSRNLKSIKIADCHIGVNHKIIVLNNNLTLQKRNRFGEVKVTLIKKRFST